MSAEGDGSSETPSVTSDAEEIPVTDQRPEPEPEPYTIVNGKGGWSEHSRNRWDV